MTPTIARANGAESFPKNEAPKELFFLVINLYFLSLKGMVKNNKKLMLKIQEMFSEFLVFEFQRKMTLM